jgi:hypothetical protein
MECYLMPKLYVSLGTSLIKDPYRRKLNGSRKKKRRRENNFSRWHQLKAGTAALHKPALPVETPRHCRWEHPGSAGRSTPTLPAQTGTAALLVCPVFPFF